MDILCSCWFIIETILIPHGFQKWYCLSFFIHPLLLVFCQVYIWIKFLACTMFALVFRPARIVWCLIVRVFRFLWDCLIWMLPLRGSDDCGVRHDNRRFQVHETSDAIQTIQLYRGRRVVHDMGKISREYGNGFEEAQEEEEEFSEESDIESSFLECTGSESLIMDREAENTRDEGEVDGFYEKYAARMKWFDLLNYERTCGMSAILNKQMGNSSSLESIQPFDFSPPYTIWSKAAIRKLQRSIESDFEMVYVGQSCLCWEALHHQYRKVEALAASASLGGDFYDMVAGKFQQFQVLLERFLENEITSGKRFWSYVQERFSMKMLLQVPDVLSCGYVGHEKEGRKMDPVFAREALKIIEKSIRTLWLFLKTDNKRSSWKIGSLLWTYPQVEDPRDIELLAHLTKMLQKKELELKKILGRRRCWLNRTHSLDESQRLQILFCMIDMKLVSRVLKMTVISTQQLQWCQEKLSNINFKEERVERACISCLFPHS